MRCEFKACPQQAIGITKFCVNHQPEPARPVALASVEDDIVVVSLEQIPLARTNEVAVSLLDTLKKLGDNKGLKVPLKKFSKPTLTTTQRYALAAGLRIGVRFIGVHAYVWKMTLDQVKAAEQKAERLAAARAKKRKAA